MNNFFKIVSLSILISNFGNNSFAQKIIEKYEPKKKDSIKIGKGKNDFLPFIQKGYTISIPEQKNIIGTLIFLEGSGFDKKNKSSKLIYEQANKNGFVVLSVSTEIPLDFYFTNNSSLISHEIIEKVL